jgi:hypothetical protein
VLIGEVSSEVVDHGTVDYASLVHRASEEELGALDLSQARAGKRFIVSISLRRMETHHSARHVDTTCKVTAAVREERSGRLLAALDGQARATGSASDVTLEEQALHGALHGAFAHLPDAIVH